MLSLWSTSDYAADSNLEALCIHLLAMICITDPEQKELMLLWWDNGYILPSLFEGF